MKKLIPCFLLLIVISAGCQTTFQAERAQDTSEFQRYVAYLDNGVRSGQLSLYEAENLKMQRYNSYQQKEVSRKQREDAAFDGLNRAAQQYSDNERKRAEAETAAMNNPIIFGGNRQQTSCRTNQQGTTYYTNCY